MFLNDTLSMFHKAAIAPGILCLNILQPSEENHSKKNLGTDPVIEYKHNYNHPVKEN